MGTGLSGRSGAQPDGRCVCLCYLPLHHKSIRRLLVVCVCLHVCMCMCMCVTRHTDVQMRKRKFFSIKYMHRYSYKKFRRFFMLHPVLHNNASYCFQTVAASDIQKNLTFIKGELNHKVLVRLFALCNN